MNPFVLQNYMACLEKSRIYSYIGFHVSRTNHLNQSINQSVNQALITSKHASKHASKQACMRASMQWINQMLNQSSLRALVWRVLTF